jgi:hypothetical protein
MLEKYGKKDPEVKSRYTSVWGNFICLPESLQVWVANRPAVVCVLFQADLIN